MFMYIIYLLFICIKSVSKINYWGYYEILTQVQTKIGGGAVPWECLPVDKFLVYLSKFSRLTRLARLSRSQEGDFVAFINLRTSRQIESARLM